MRGWIKFEAPTSLQPTIWIVKDWEMSSEPPRILLVDDEQSVQTLLTYPLRKDGYEVVTATTGREALDRFRDGHFDLVVLDVMLPETDGFDVCKQLRARSSVPIIMLTAKAEEIDKVLGLELGADDYITKPFSVREFRSRVKAVLRRAALSRSEDAPEDPIEEGDLRVDFEKRQVEVRGELVRLTYVEFEILAALFSVISFVVVPQLESKLKDRNLQDLTSLAVSGNSRFSAIIGSDVPAGVIDRRVRAAAESANARVTLASIQQSLTGPRGQG